MNVYQPSLASLTSVHRIPATHPSRVSTLNALSCFSSQFTRHQPGPPHVYSTRSADHSENKPTPSAHIRPCKSKKTRMPIGLVWCVQAGTENLYGGVADRIRGGDPHELVGRIQSRSYIRTLTFSQSLLIMNKSRLNGDICAVTVSSMHRQYINISVYIHPSTKRRRASKTRLVQSIDTSTRARRKHESSASRILYTQARTLP